ncbi:MAG: O-succinylhomoserine sulfhydrylase [Pseudomonadota bacterium]
MKSEINRRAETLHVHGGSVRSHHGETSEAIYLTQGFIYDSAERAEARFKGDDPGFVYSRYANPTVGMFEERMRLLEGMESAKATASGMAAVSSAIACHVSAGDHIVAARALFGSCRWVVEKLMPKFGVECTLVDGKDIDAWKEATRPNTTLYFLESPTNPTLELVDIKAVADLAHENDAILVVDNVFATPLYQRPADLGADVVVYSATKHIDGQGRCLGGVILSSEEWNAEKLYDYYRHTGPSLSPFNAWNLLKGLETLPLRVERQTASAGKLTEFLASQKGVARVIYPGNDDHPQAELAKRQMKAGSTLLAFEVDGGKSRAFEFLNRLQLIMISNNLGDAKSLITHPATTTHKNLDEDERALVGISDGLLRLSVGLEHADDLMEDLAQALG